MFTPYPKKKSKQKGKRLNIERLLEIEKTVKGMFKAAEEQGLYLGLGREGSLPNNRESQEGPIVKKLRKLIYETE